MGSHDLKLDIEFLKFMKFKNGAECLRRVLGVMLWSLEWYVFLFFFFSFLNYSMLFLISCDAAFERFSTFFGGVGYLLYLRNLYKFVCSFSLHLSFFNVRLSIAS